MISDGGQHCELSLGTNIVFPRFLEPTEVGGICYIYFGHFIVLYMEQSTAGVLSSNETA